LMVKVSDSSPLDKVRVKGGDFYAGGKKLWINGTNTPWNSWNDFGGSYDEKWWDEHFALLHAHGINAVRIWISCDGTVGINIDDNGLVTGVTDKYWSDLDSLFSLAQKHRLYIMATTMSFDHCKYAHGRYKSWRNMIKSEKAVDSYIENYLLPLVERYKGNTALWSIDLCNEPDWINENKECGEIPWDLLTRLFAKSTAAIHKTSDILVTVGIAVIKNNKYVNDGSMLAALNDRAACLDFYSPHHYPWMIPHFGIPFYTTPEKYGVEPGKPVVIAECPPLGTPGRSLTEDYVSAFENGWHGIMPWTSNGVDTCGSLEDMKETLKLMLENHRDVILP